VSADDIPEPIDLAGMEVPPEVIERVPAQVAQIYRVAPVRFDPKSDTLTFAAADVDNLPARDDLRFLFGCRVEFLPSNEEAVADAIERYYPFDIEAELRETVEEFENPTPPPTAGVRAARTLRRLGGRIRSGVSGLFGGMTGNERNEDEELGDDSPEIRFVSAAIAATIRERAGGFLLEATEEGCRLSLLAGGLPRELMMIPRAFGQICMERVKHMAGMDRPGLHPDPPNAGLIMITLYGRRHVCHVTMSSSESGESAEILVEGQTFIFISIGSSIEPEKNIPAALARLWDHARVLRYSPFYHTPAIGRPDDPDFYNCVVSVWTRLDPRELKFDALRKIEAELGRVRTDDGCAPRTIDLDLLLYGDLVVDEPDLRLPDPDILERPWLAAGLLELEPELVMPDTAKPLAGLVPPEARAGLEPVRIFTEKVWEKLKNEREARR